MKGVVFLGNRQAEVREFPDPTPGPGEVVLQLRVSGLCGSDLHLYRQSAEQCAGNDTIPGHEPCGVVHSIGAGVTNVQTGGSGCRLPLSGLWLLPSLSGRQHHVV